MHKLLHLNTVPMPMIPRREILVSPLHSDFFCDSFRYREHSLDILIIPSTARMMAWSARPPGTGRRGGSTSTRTLYGGTLNASRNSSELPPSYFDLFPRPHPPCNMEPLVEAMWHNQTISSLPRLPENALKIVIQNLDNCSLECFRRVSREFTPLCDKEVLNRPNTYQPIFKVKDRGGPFAWPRFRVFNGPWKENSRQERQRLIHLLSRDWYCGGCLAAQEAPDWDRRVKQLTKYLYCQPCKAQHPACLFSAQQRRSRTSRRCIAHEGFIRLCQHNEGMVRWSEISRIRQRLEEGVKDEDEYDVRCMDINHVTPCAHTGTQRSGQTTFRPGCGDYHCSERPSPTLWVRGPTVWLQWTAHVPFNLNGGRLTAADLRSRITEIREKGGRFLYPTITPTADVPEMRCFDPNDCDCVPLEGCVDIDLHFNSSQDPAERVCRLNPSRRLNPLRRSSWVWSTYPLVDGIWRLFREHEWDFLWKCGASTKRHRTRYDINLRYLAGHVTVDCWPCHAGDECLVFEYTRFMTTIGDDGGIGVEWYQALETDSYDLVGDEAGFEVYWCRQKECRNYHRRVPGFTRIVRGAEFHRHRAEDHTHRPEEAYWSSVVS